MLTESTITRNARLNARLEDTAITTQATVIRVLEDVVGAKNLNADSRFLDIGGNSLNLVEVLKQLRAKTGVAPSPRIFFDKQTSSVAAISAAIDAQLHTSELAETAG
ncbi:acyl carrier protein [Breoghania sp. JC706]|uniref:acyl carrier protein n=1 Tax=Breoghania sp. JC706 TaxID=3117732 RepID=UPI00300B6D1D